MRLYERRKINEEIIKYSDAIAIEQKSVTSSLTTAIGENNMTIKNINNCLADIKSNITKVTDENNALIEAKHQSIIQENNSKFKTVLDKLKAIRCLDPPPNITYKLMKYQCLNLEKIHIYVTLKT